MKKIYVLLIAVSMIALSSCASNDKAVVATWSCIEPDVPVIEAGDYKKIRITKHIMFDWDSAAIRADQTGKLDEIVDVLEKHQDVTLEIKGFASTEGDLDYNLNLSQRRADAVVASLIDRGVNNERIAIVVAEGETSDFGNLLKNNRKVLVITIN